MNWRKMHRNRRKQQQIKYELYRVTCDGRTTKKPIIVSNSPIKMIWTHRRSYTLSELTFVPSHQVPLID